MATYKRILLKLSGESLMGEKQYGIDEKRLAEYAAQIKEIQLRKYTRWAYKSASLSAAATSSAD